MYSRECIICVAAAWTKTQVRRVPDRGPLGLHLDLARPPELHVQTDVPRRGRAAVPRADLHPAPLGAPTLAEGQVSAVQQGESRTNAPPINPNFLSTPKLRLIHPRNCVRCQSFPLSPVRRCTCSVDRSREKPFSSGPYRTHRVGLFIERSCQLLLRRRRRNNKTLRNFEFKYSFFKLLIYS
jgi:hypothetical protein